MPRPTKPRWVEVEPASAWFAPTHGPARAHTVVELAVDELEALRLKDVEGLPQEECAAHMNLSQSSFQRLLAGARAKVASALVRGEALRIGGGHYVKVGMGCRCGHRWRSCDGAGTQDDGRSGCCPSCGSHEVRLIPIDEGGR